MRTMAQETRDFSAFHCERDPERVIISPGTQEWRNDGRAQGASTRSLKTNRIDSQSL